MVLLGLKLLFRRRRERSEVIERSDIFQWWRVWLAVEVFHAILIAFTAMNLYRRELSVVIVIVMGGLFFFFFDWAAATLSSALDLLLGLRNREAFQ